MGNKADLRRRWLGAIFLGTSVLLLIAGETLLKSHLSANPWLALIYWLGCFLAVILAIFVALIDLAVVRRRNREEQRGLLTETLDQIAHEKRSQSGKSPPSDKQL